MLVTSLLTAIVRANGDALVMHVGERPYVVTSGGHVDLSTSGLALEAMSGMLTQLLPPDAMRGLSEFGAVEHELRPPQGFHDRFTVVAARGGDDIWIEIRRKRQLPLAAPAAPAVAREEPPASFGEASSASARAETPLSFGEASAVAVPPAAAAEVEVPPEPAVAEPVVAMTEPVIDEIAPEPADAEDELYELMANGTAHIEILDESEEPAAAPAFAREEPPASFGVASSPEPVASASARTEMDASYGETSPKPMASEIGEGGPKRPEMESREGRPIAPVAPEPVAPEPVAAEHPPSLAQAPDASFGEASRTAPAAPSASASARAETDASYGETSSASARVEMQPSYGETSPKPMASEIGEGGPKRPDIESREGGPAAPVAPGVVVPMTRTVRIEVPPRNVTERQSGVDRFLSIAGARGASVLYLTSQSRPFMRVDGEIRAMDGEAPLTGADVEAAVLELMPESAREAHGRGEPAEWVSEFEGLGRIRCTTFRDYRGPGAIFHLISARPMSAEQLGLPREIQALATESEGLVLVASPRGGGKSTLLAALVDAINRNEGGYIVSLERQIRIVHENRQSLVSQREVRGTAGDAVNVARAALRENPDVLVIEDLNSPEVIQLALDAAGSGLLVFLSVTAGSTVSALARIIDLFPPERRKTVQAVLAERLRAAVSQVLLRKVGGGRLPARELLLTTAAVASLIAEGQMAQLPVAIDSGRKLGMVSLNEALVGYLRSGLIDAREAYRKADDRAGLLALLKRDGADTSTVDRLA